MKRKGLSKSAANIILLVLSAIFAFVFWFAVEYSQFGGFLYTLFNFG